MAEMTDLPMCPYCDHIERDAWEIEFGPGIEGDTIHTCASCGEDYDLSRIAIVYYTSQRLADHAR